MYVTLPQLRPRQHPRAAPGLKLSTSSALGAAAVVATARHCVHTEDCAVPAQSGTRAHTYTGRPDKGWWGESEALRVYRERLGAKIHRPPEHPSWVVGAAAALDGAAADYTLSYSS